MSAPTPIHSAIFCRSPSIAARTANPECVLRRSSWAKTSTISFTHFNANSSGLLLPLAADLPLPLSLPLALPSPLPPFSASLPSFADFPMYTPKKVLSASVTSFVSLLQWCGKRFRTCRNARATFTTGIFTKFVDMRETTSFRAMAPASWECNVGL